MKTNISKVNHTRIAVLLSILMALFVLNLVVFTKDIKPAHAASASYISNPAVYNQSSIILDQSQQTDNSFLIFLPIVMKPLLIPDVPVLNQIDNSDQNNIFTISWSSVPLADAYVLEETTDPSFATANIVYQGSALSWTTPPQGKTPANYFYRLKAQNFGGDSSWSNIQFITIYPLFVGLQLRWDGEGYIRGSEYYNIGVHWENNLDILTDPDTIRSNNQHWYDPNPNGWANDTWFTYYSISTGNWLSSSTPSDPSWKWGYSWKLGYTSQFTNGQIVTIDGQAFTVSGPHSGYTAFGKPVQYWQFVNNDKFLFWDNGGDWKQYCHPGDITLRYDAGNSRLEIYSSIMRRYYYQGSLTSDTVQYIENLTFANSFPGVTTNIQGDLAPFIVPQQVNDNERIDFQESLGRFR